MAAEINGKASVALLSQDRQCTVAGQSFTLRYSTKAFAALQDLWRAAGLNEVLARVDTGVANMDMTVAVDLFWAGLRAHHKGMTREAVLDLFDESGVSGFPALTEEIMLAIKAAMPPADEVREARPPMTTEKTSATMN